MKPQLSHWGLNLPRYNFHFFRKWGLSVIRCKAKKRVPDKPALGSQPLSAQSRRASHLTSVSLSFFSCKTEIIVPFSWGCLEDESPPDGS